MATQPGVVVGVVGDLNDPEGLGRVQVTFPHLADEPSNWARLALPMAGAGRGTFFRPEKGDEVLIACEHGDIRQPYVVGTLWSKTDPPPDGTGTATDNNIRVIVSRSGHRITLDDTQGSERIEITDHAMKQAVVLDGSSITVQAGAGQVTISASGDVTVSAGGNLNLTATETVTITGAQVTIN
ncbi:MAG TPA: phage baseplate assembly protein V [Streptosporangiaceae bacterium]|jgi:uncharacterized protein involved in type VI secretion and phage assembly|nr:phage baseplate assembly protein V [Streptosporangiaceae bacterium]